MKRREAIITLAGAGLLAPAVLSADVPQEGAGGELAKGLERLATRVYSEEGIPMLLVCESVGAEQPAPTSNLNQIVATAFRRYAGEWEQLHPNAPADDVNKIVEFLADRDFANGGKEKSL